MIRFDPIRGLAVGFVIAYPLLGRLSSGPLHNIDSRFERVIFDDSLESIRLIGTTFDYTYTIPTEILQLRGNV